MKCLAFQSVEKTTNTQWHNLVAWGNTAGLAESYLKKENEIAIYLFKPVNYKLNPAEYTFVFENLYIICNFEK